MLPQRYGLPVTGRPAANLLLGASRAGERGVELGTLVQLTLRPYAAVPLTVDRAGNECELGENGVRGNLSGPIPRRDTAGAHDSFRPQTANNKKGPISGAFQVPL